MKNEPITRDQLIDLLRSLLEDRHTTSLYVHTDDNQLIVIGINQGEIVSLRCGSKRGEQAIPMIRDMNAATYRLYDQIAPRPNVGVKLPPSETLLSLLSEAGGAEADDDCQWVHDVLCKVLGEYMGPIAPVICSEAVEAVGGLDSQEKIQQVVEQIALEIDSPAEAQRFRVQAQSELGSQR